MVNIHFIEDPTALSIIQTILELAGPNYNAPYDSDTQPNNANERNNETLIQYQLPGGSELKGYAEPASSQNMGSAINSMLAVVAPFISAYGLILPILGVIRGLIEIMCAMMNPFAVIAAVIRLFVKWIPPFISLFPPFAGIIIILSTIKAILAIVFFIMTEIVPTVQLIISCIKELSGIPASASIEERQAIIQNCQQMIEKVITDLANRFGILALLLPLLELIFLLLGLVTGFPCSGGKRSDCSRGSLPRGGDENYPCDESDTTNECPQVLKDPPQGSAILIPSFFGDSIPFFAYLVITLDGNARIPEIRPFLQDFKSQLDPQLDEPVDEASPFGGDGNTAHFNLEITDKRGNTITSPIAKTYGNVIVTINPILITKIGLVDYKIVPNYPMLVGRNIIGVGCHPDVEAVISQLQARMGDTELSALDKNPEAANLLGDVNDLNDDLDGSIARLRTLNNNDLPNPAIPIDTVISGFQEEQDFLINRLFGFQNDLKTIMNAVIARSTDRVTSELAVDKNIVKAGGGDNIATVIVTPRDFTGATIAKNIPDGVDVAVDIFTDFGTLANQQRNNATGQITAELSSPFPGVATISAKVNQDFITTFDGNTEVVKELEVQFIADSILPKRRKVSRVGQTTKSATGSSSDREPGGR